MRTGGRYLVSSELSPEYLASINRVIVLIEKSRISPCGTVIEIPSDDWRIYRRVLANGTLVELS